MTGNAGGPHGRRRTCLANCSKYTVSTPRTSAAHEIGSQIRATATSSSVMIAVRHEWEPRAESCACRYLTKERKHRWCANRTHSHWCCLKVEDRRHAGDRGEAAAKKGPLRSSIIVAGPFFHQEGQQAMFVMFFFSGMRRQCRPMKQWNFLFCVMNVRNRQDFRKQCMKICVFRLHFFSLFLNESIPCCDTRRAGYGAHLDYHHTNWVPVIPSVLKFPRQYNRSGWLEPACSDRVT